MQFHQQPFLLATMKTPQPDPPCHSRAPLLGAQILALFCPHLIVGTALEGVMHIVLVMIDSGHGKAKISK